MRAGAALMARSEPTDEPPEPDPERASVQHPSLLRPGASLLARASRLLSGVADDADDATLMTLLGPLVVPALGDVAALYTVDSAGLVTLVGAEPSQNGLVQRLRGHLQRHPDAARITYAELATLAQPAIVRPAGPDLPAGVKSYEAAPNRVLGLAAEIVAPLGDGAESDALLTIGSLDRARQYGDADLATVEVLAALVAGRRAIRTLLHREARLQQQIEDSALAGRELAHQLNNDLTMPVGVLELLLDRGPPDSDLQEMLAAASKDLTALEQHIRDFHEQMRGQSGAPAGPRPPDY
jgi:signal transduction histidine kinase